MFAFVEENTPLREGWYIGRFVLLLVLKTYGKVKEVVNEVKSLYPLP